MGLSPLQIFEFLQSGDRLQTYLRQILMSTVGACAVSPVRVKYNNIDFFF